MNTLVVPSMDGILPIDTYKEDVDEITSQELTHDWEVLEYLSPNSVSDTQHCLSIPSETVPLCQTNKWNRTT